MNSSYYTLKVGETYNIGGNNEIQNIEVVRKVCQYSR